MQVRLLVDLWQRGAELTPAGEIIEVDEAFGLHLLAHGEAERLLGQPETAVAPEYDTAARTKRPKRKKL